MRKPVDVTARVNAGGVEIHVPRVTVEIERRQAERLRDELNAVLPERIRNLIHDPRLPELQEGRA